MHIDVSEYSTFARSCSARPTGKRRIQSQSRLVFSEEVPYRPENPAVKLPCLYPSLAVTEHAQALLPADAAGDYGGTSEQLDLDALNNKTRPRHLRPQGEYHSHGANIYDHSQYVHATCSIGREHWACCSEIAKRRSLTRMCTGYRPHTRGQYPVRLRVNHRHLGLPAIRSAGKVLF